MDRSWNCSWNRSWLCRSKSGFRCIFVALALAICTMPLHAQSVLANSVAYVPSDTPSDQLAPEVVEMQKVTDQWDDAVLQRDAYALDLVLSPKMIDISSSGQITHRDQWVALVTQKSSPVRTLNQTVTHVSLLGDVAIVNGTYDVKFKPDDEHRPQKDETGIYSQVFQRLQNSWVCINSQRTTLASASSDKNEKKDKKNKEARNEAAPAFSFPGNLPR